MNPALLKNFFNRGQKGVIFASNTLNKPEFSVKISMCIHRTIQVGCLDSMLKIMMCKNPKVTVSNAMGDALIDRARSREASDFFRNTQDDVLLMIDDDIQFNPLDAIKVARLAYEKKGIACGAYVIKKEQFGWITCKPLENSEPIMFSSDAVPIEVKWPGTGFLAIHRNVFQDLIDEAHKFHEYHPNHIDLLHPTDLKFWDFFMPMKYKFPNGDKIELSEDWAFGEKCRKIGRASCRERV